MNALLQVQSVSKAVRTNQLVQDVSLDIQKGEIFGIVGPNGAGKTTLLRIVCGFVAPDQGAVRINGASLRESFTDAIKHVGAFIETPAFHGNLSAYENLRLTAKILDVPTARITEVLEIVGLPDVGKKQVKAFSLGMRQRLGIAHAILGNPPLLILDEPTNGLDPQGIIDMRNLIRDLQHHGFTILLASHLLNEVELVCTRIALMRSGRVIVQKSVQEFLQASDADKWMYHLRVEPMLTVERWQELFPDAGEVQVRADGSLYLRLHEDIISTIVQTVVMHGYVLKEVVHKNRSLEEVFLQYLEDGEG